MRGVFVDANDSLAEIFERQRKAGDPDVKVHLEGPAEGAWAKTGRISQ